MKRTGMRRRRKYNEIFENLLSSPSLGSQSPAPSTKGTRTRQQQPKVETPKPMVASKQPKAEPTKPKAASKQPKTKSSLSDSGLVVGGFTDPEGHKWHFVYPLLGPAPKSQGRKTKPATRRKTR